MNKQRKLYMDLINKKWEHIQQLRDSVIKHSDYNNCQIAVDMLMDSYHYESGTIVGISPTREGFDDIYDYSSLYRGGFEEIKVGSNYVIYGFEFD